MQKPNMNTNEIHQTRSLWNRVADDWCKQVGDDGDRNRILNSDPVLWDFAGDISGLAVLDAGCGTGYLTRKLSERGACVIGVDFSEKMIEIARAKAPQLDFRVDSCSALSSVQDGSVDLVISDYVLMDTPDLDETVHAFYRVLNGTGIAIIVFSHPCFPADFASDTPDGKGVQCRWEFPYFSQRKIVAPPWGHFTSDFIWYHRPLSDYWKAFRTAGFDVLEIEEPRLTSDRQHLALNEGELQKSTSRPYSVAFKLKKQA
jgi:SAM-dependent methyltransferase